MKTLFILFKLLSIAAGLAAYQDAIPKQYLGWAIFAFTLASTLKDIVLKIGDKLDDGEMNNSFNPDKNSPPPASGASPAGCVTGLLVSLGAASLLFCSGCVALAPGARPEVVRTEQSLAVANATFNGVVHVDQSNRPYFRTNAPGFHAFAEWLRQPVTLPPLTNAEPRGIAIIRSANAVKNTYKSQPTTNNYAALITSLATVEAATAQAQSWLASVTATTNTNK